MHCCNLERAGVAACTGLGAGREVSGNLAALDAVGCWKQFGYEAGGGTVAGTFVS